MSSFDDFVHIPMHPPPRPPPAGGHHHPHHPQSGGVPTVAHSFYENSKGLREFTQGLIVSAIKAKHPSHHVTIFSSYSCDILGFASSGKAKYKIHGDPKDILTEKSFMPPARRYGDESGGRFLENIKYGCYEYDYNGTTFLLYVVEGKDGPYTFKYSYLLEDIRSSSSERFLLEGEKMGSETKASTKSDELIEAASKWLIELHGEVLVFDQGYWQKNKELYDQIQKSEWEDVILEKERKVAIIDDIIGFFNAESRYSEFGVPWKRGVIFYGPPGNGKTISTKALMHDISKRMNPVIESLYVKTFNSYAGPEFGIRQIFQMARRMAPCLLIFEDIDSLILPNVRSYFLNEVDGLESNHGILMIGSTNHLERLDPGIAKRPSRFDRKYLFDVPSRDERIQYCEYWRSKLESNKQVDFPVELSARVADITDKFSFAYMKEAFIASLLSIVRSGAPKAPTTQEDKLANNVLWKELQKQIGNLRKEMEGEDPDDYYAVPVLPVTQPEHPIAYPSQPSQPRHILSTPEAEDRRAFYASGNRSGFPGISSYGPRGYPSCSNPLWESAQSMGHTQQSIESMEQLMEQVNLNRNLGLGLGRN